MATEKPRKKQFPVAQTEPNGHCQHVGHPV